MVHRFVVIALGERLPNAAKRLDMVRILLEYSLEELLRLDHAPLTLPDARHLQRRLHRLPVKIREARPEAERTFRIGLRAQARQHRQCVALARVELQGGLELFFCRGDIATLLQGVAVIQSRRYPRRLDLDQLPKGPIRRIPVAPPAVNTTKLLEQSAVAGTNLG